MSEFGRLIEEQIPRLQRYARALTGNRTQAFAGGAAPGTAADRG
jgi:DNA-directed RNA polymerase specialized sigma24 family protein